MQDGLEFLSKIRNGETPACQGISAVIGGGNTAVDVARSIVRLGGRAVILYRRRRQDMPAFGDEVQMALEEGVELVELVAPARIESGERPLPRHLAEDEGCRRGWRPRPRGARRGQNLRGRLSTASSRQPAQRPPRAGTTRRQGLQSILTLSHCTLAKGDGRSGDAVRRRSDKRHQERRPRRCLRQAGRHGPRHALAGRPRRRSCRNSMPAPSAAARRFPWKSTWEGNEGCATRTWLPTTRSTRTTSVIRPA